MAEVVYSRVADDTNVQGALFKGIKFWISHKVPQRSRFLNDVKANGGEVLPLEKNADVKIVDHARKEAPPGSHSYTFIDISVRNGVLEDLDDHRVGPPEGTIRNIGSIVQPAKATRNKYTEADDRLLWDWVNDHPQKGGGTDGNEIYKQLELKHPQHPWQSWRDRWIKHLKGRRPAFALPHNAPLTPPSDVAPTNEPSKVRTTTLDPAEDDYSSFSDDDAEALMVNGDGILNIHPDSVTEAWESWARDHDKDSVHTAQQWHSYWVEKVRPRYLRRMAKQTQRASPEKTSPAKPQVFCSPKRPVAAPPSAFSPSKRKYPLVPNVPKPMVPNFQNQPSPKRSTAPLQSTFSPVSKLHYSLVPESPEKTASFGVGNHVSPKRSAVIPASGSSPSVERYSSLKPVARSPSDQADSPPVTITSPSIFRQATDILSIHEPGLPSNNTRHIQRTPEKILLPYHEALKRKHDAIEEDLPSSSPMGPISPKRKRPTASELPEEIASTPESRRDQYIEGQFSPLPIKLELEEDEPNVFYDFTETESLLGQQLSDTLSEPGRVVNDTQAAFLDATQLIDFDVPAPEGGWDDDELPVQDSSQPVGFDVPPPESRRKHSTRGVAESTQLVDFDIPPPEGGWSDEEEQPQIKEETETDNPQPTLPDTQAILRSKTPAPDFTLAAPDGGWSSLIASSSPAAPSSPRPESVFSQTEVQDQLDAWIDARAVDGISIPQVEAVLKSTSMDTALADKALRRLAKRGALPTRWRGVWTAADDEDLTSTDARRIQRLHEKHGAECLAARWEFLAFYAGDGGGG